MAYRIVGPNVDYTLPGTVDMTELDLGFQAATVKLPGRFGVQVPVLGQSQAAQTCTISGLLKGTSSSALVTILTNFSRAFNVQGEYRIEDTTLDRWARARTISFRHSRIPSGGKTVRVEAQILLVEGAWRSTVDHDSQGVTFETYPDKQTATVSTTGAAAYVGLLVFDYAGSAPASPVLHATLNAGVTWTPALVYKGGNLLRNASFEDGANSPDAWSLQGTPKPSHGEARSGARSVLVSSTNYTYQDVTVNASQPYTFSAYFKPATVAATAEIQVDWLSYTDGVASTAGTTAALNATDEWERVQFTVAAPASIVEARCRLQARVGASVLVDDAQVEQVDATSDTATPFVASRHVEFSRNASLTATSWQEYAVDMERGTARLLDTSTAWTDDLGAITGQFFDLVPGEGKQHIEVSAPSGTDVPVELWYQTRHIW